MASTTDKRAAYVAVAGVIHALQEVRTSNQAIVRCVLAGIVNPGKLRHAHNLLEEVALGLGDTLLSAHENAARTSGKSRQSSPHIEDPGKGRPRGVAAHRMREKAKTARKP